MWLCPFLHTLGRVRKITEDAWWRWKAVHVFSSVHDTFRHPFGDDQNRATWGTEGQKCVGGVPKEYGQCSVCFTPVGYHQPPRPRLQADKGLAGCSEGNDGQLEKHTCRLNFRRAKYKFQAFAHIEDSVRTAVLLVWLFLVPTEARALWSCHQQHTGICGRVFFLFCPCTSLGESEWNQSDHSIHLE